MACEDPEVIEAIDASLIAALSGPKRVKGDAGEVEQYSIAERIAARKFLASQCASDNPRRGLRITKLIPPGPA